MKTQHECGSLIFSHTVGSALIDNRSEDSDVDILSVYTHSMSVNMLIPIDIDVTSVHSTEYKTPVIDGLSVTGISLVYDLINDTEIPMSTLSKIISHLYAVKYNLMLSVDDKEVFNTIKKAKNKCESIVLHKTAKGEIPQALGIFVLKAYHGLIEVQRQEIKADVTTKTDHDFKIIEGE